MIFCCFYLLFERKSPSYHSYPNSYLLVISITKKNHGMTHQPNLHANSFSLIVNFSSKGNEVSIKNVCVYGNVEIWQLTGSNTKKQRKSETTSLNRVILSRYSTESVFLLNLNVLCTYISRYRVIFKVIQLKHVRIDSVEDFAQSPLFIN